MASSGVAYWGNSSVLQNASTGELVLRNLFLSIPMFIGFVLNILVLVIVARHRSVRHVSLNKFLMNLSVACLADTVLNMPFILSTSIYQDWPTTSGFCVANSFFLYLIDTEILLGVLLLVFDRYVLCREPRRYEMQLHYSRTIAIICLAWFSGVVLGIPIFATSDSAPAPSYLFVPIFACTYGPQASAAYVLFLLCFIIVIPVLTILLLYILVIRTEGDRERDERERTDRRPDTASSLNTIGTLTSNGEQLGSNLSLIAIGPVPAPRPRTVCDPETWLEQRGYLLTAALTLCWSVTVLPCLLYLNVQRVSASLSLDSLLYVNYPLNTTLFWLRSQFALLMPTVLLFKHPAIRQKACALLCCTCALRSATKVSGQNVQSGKLEPPRTNGAPIPSVALQIPVIYATNQGLQMKTYQDRSGDAPQPRVSRKRKIFLDVDAVPSVSSSSAGSSRAIVHPAAPPSPSAPAAPSVPCDVNVAGRDDVSLSSSQLSDPDSGSERDDNAHANVNVHVNDAFGLDSHVQSPRADEAHNLDFYQYYVESDDRSRRTPREISIEIDEDLDREQRAKRSDRRKKSSRHRLDSASPLRDDLQGKSPQHHYDKRARHSDQKHRKTRSQLQADDNPPPPPPPPPPTQDSDSLRQATEITVQAQEHHGNHGNGTLRLSSQVNGLDDNKAALTLSAPTHSHSRSYSRSQSSGNQPQIAPLDGAAESSESGLVFNSVKNTVAESDGTKNERKSKRKHRSRKSSSIPFVQEVDGELRA